MLRRAAIGTEVSNIPSQTNVQTPLETTNLRGSGNLPNTDTLQSSQSDGCCTSVTDVFSGLMSLLYSTLIGIKEWLFSCFSPAAETNVQLKVDPRNYFQDPSLPNYHKLRGFYQLLRELTERLPDPQCAYRPVGMSDERMKAEVLALYQDGVPDPIKIVLDREFAQEDETYKISTIPREHETFRQCLERDPEEAKAIVRDLLRCQLSYYNEHGMSYRNENLDNLRVFVKMLHLCKRDPLIQVQLIADDSFFDELKNAFAFLPEEYRKALDAQFSEGSLEKAIENAKGDPLQLDAVFNQLEQNIMTSYFPRGLETGPMRIKRHSTEEI